MSSDSATRQVLRFAGPVAADRLDRPDAIGTGQVLRLLTRQLYAYPDVPAEATAIADAAVGPPEPSGDGRTYRIRLRSGIRWDAVQAREITAGDFIRGIKRTAHPLARPVRPYFAAMIDGLGEYYAAYDEAFGHWVPHAPAFAQFQMHTAVPGLRAEDDKTLAVRLIGPGDALPDLLATGYSAAAPREYDYYVPDSPELYRCNPAAGPYRIVRQLSPGGDLVLEPNPRWDQDTDPIRRRPVDRIEISRTAAGDTPPVAEPGPLVRYSLSCSGDVPADLAGRLALTALPAALIAAGATAATAAAATGSGPVPGLTLANPAGDRLRPLVDALAGLGFKPVEDGPAEVVLRERIPYWPVDLPGDPADGEIALLTAQWARVPADCRTGGVANWGF